VDKEKIQLQAYIEWMEFNVFKLPRPTKVIYLDVPPVVSRQQIINRGEPTDIYESDWNYIREVYAVGRKLANTHNWMVIDCIEGDRMKTPEEIHKSIVYRLNL
jgi:dTMP kinase